MEYHRRILVRLIGCIAVLTAPSVQQECECGQVNKVITDVTLGQIFNEPTISGTQISCTRNCAYHVWLSYDVAMDPRYGGISIYMEYFDNKNGDASLCFFDGEISSVPVRCVNESITADVMLNSTSSSTAAITLAQSPGASAAQFYVTCRANSSNKTTTMPPSPNYDCDPAELQLDLAIVLDCSGWSDPAVFSQMLRFAGTTLLSHMNITTNADSTRVTRIAYAKAVPLGSEQPDDMIPLGTYNRTQFEQNVISRSIQQLMSLGYAGFTVALTKLKVEAFNESRPNANRVVLILIGSDIAYEEGLNATFNGYASENIHIIVVQVGKESNITVYNPGQNVYYSKDVDINDDLVNITNKYFCNQMEASSSTSIASSSIGSTTATTTLATRTTASTDSIATTHNITNSTTTSSTNSPTTTKITTETSQNSDITVETEKMSTQTYYSSTAETISLTTARGNGDKDKTLWIILVVGAATVLILQ